MKNLSFNLNSKNILITGGAGFLGSQIVDAFSEQKSNVYVLDVKKPVKKPGVTYFKTDITKEKDLSKVLFFLKKKK